MHRSSFTRISFFIICLWFAAPWAAAAIKLPSLFSENMVLQAGAKDPVWGTTTPQQRVTVTLDGAQATTMADASGRWKVELGPLQPGGPFDLKVAGENTVVIHNVLVGQVWLCSGQSNMVFPVAPQVNASQIGVVHYRQAIASAHYPMIRLFTVKRTTAGSPQRKVVGSWQITSPVTVGRFSAVAYFFGLNLFKALHEPIGLISSSWGGTPAEAWTTMKTLKSNPEFASIFTTWRKREQNYPAKIAQYNSALREWEQATRRANAEGNPGPRAPRLPGNPYDAAKRPSVLFNAMINPLIPYRIKGAIWYQGEANADRPIQYRTLFPDMIRDWRRAWGEGDFPFLFVQLPGFQNIHPPKSWPLLREAQFKALSVPNTAMAVTIDVGSPMRLHPRNKQAVGRRLSLAARALAYHQKIIYSGPLYSSMQIEGNRIRLHFTHLGGGLVDRRLKGNRSSPEDFEIAGANRKFYSAYARIEGNTIVVESSLVPHPVAVRYEWQNYPLCNLYNQAGLPAAPFRTDDWPQ